MPIPTFRALVVCAAAAVLSWAPGPGAQEPQAAQQPEPFRTQASYVRVDVYPTRDGRPVMDLRAEEFELLEDGRPQRIEAFEHVVIAPAGPESLRIEADAVQRGEQMAADPRRRVFVFFLDLAHVAVEGSHAIKEPLIRLMDDVLGPDDLVAVMTSEMSAAQITLGRKTQVIAEMLRENWTWGMRHQLMPMDQREIEYEFCFPGLSPPERKQLVAQLVQRRRERMVLDALHDLVRYLGGIREERKAILTITEGWLLYRPDASLLALRRREPPPGRDPIGVDEWGKLRINPPERGLDDVNTSEARCNRERMHLANIDNEHYFRELLDAANRNNASFYPIDPRGLAVFDTPLGPDAPPAITVDMRRVSHKVEVLRTLAENTDGLAVVNSNDLDAGLRRVADDLTSYYLLGYYSTNTALDGGYRRIRVRVNRPGVEVRARRGYRAPTAEEVRAARAASAAPASGRTRTAAEAISALARLRPDQRFSIIPVALRDRPDGPVTSIWIAGELRGPAPGGRAVVEVSGGASAGTSVPLPPREHAFIVKIPVQSPGAAVDVRVRVTPAAGGEALVAAARVDPDAPPTPLLFRRGPSTGNQVRPAADLRFSRTEHLRLQLPVSGDVTAPSAQLLDRQGQPLQVPVDVEATVDAEGHRWLAAELHLAPLAPADYVIELRYTVSGGEQRVLAPVRVTR